MNTTDKVCKEVVDLFSFVKEQAVKSVVLENTSERTTLSEQDLERVVSVLNAALETSFQRGFSNLQKQVNKLITAEVDTAKKKK